MVECNDKNCPEHGTLSVRGNVFTGRVVSAKPGKTAIVERTIVRYVPKYERYRKSKSRISAHNPDCISAKEDDIVKVGETRKISKTKSFVVLEITGKQTIVKGEEDTFQEKKRTKEKTPAEEGIKEEVPGEKEIKETEENKGRAEETPAVKEKAEEKPAGKKEE